MMEVVILSEVEVFVTVVSPYNTDVKKHIVKDPFSSEIAELQKTSRKHDREEVIEKNNPKFYLKVFPDEKKQCSTLTVVNDNLKGAQPESIGIPIDSTFSKSQQCGKLETMSDANQYVQCTDTDKVSTDHDIFFLEQDGVKIKDTETSSNKMNVKVEVLQNLQYENQITVGERLADKNKLSTPFLENTTCEEISPIDQSPHVIVIENTTCEEISVVDQSPHVDLLINTTCEEVFAVGKSQHVNLIENTSCDDISAVDQSSRLDKTVENTTCEEISAVNQSVSVVCSKRPHKRHIYKGYKKRKSPRNKRMKTSIESKDDTVEKKNVFDHTLQCKVEMMECGNSTQDVENLVNTDSNEKKSGHFLDISGKEENDEANLNALNSTSEAQEKFRCNICHRNFVSNRCLQRHLTTQRHLDKEQLDGKERRFKCDVCFKDFKRNSSLQKHKMIHTDERPFKCSFCNQRFRQKHTMTQHILIHTGEKQFKCQVCDKEFRREYELKDHILVHTGEKPFECSVCPKRFSRRKNLENHERLHTNNRAFMCEICGKGFTCNNNLQTHIRIHTEGKTHLCKICGKGFTQKHQLSRHAMIHSSLKPFVCEVCGFQTADPDTLRCHMRRHTGERPFSCELCERKFRKKNTLRRHQIIHERGPKKRGRKFSNVIKVYPCHICGKTFAKNSRLTRHLKTHERKAQQSSQVVIEQLEGDQFSSDVADIIVLTF